MTPKEVKQAIKDGKEVFFDDVSYPWSLGIKAIPAKYSPNHFISNSSRYGIK